MSEAMVKVKVYAQREDMYRLVELPDGAVGIIDADGVWVHGPLPRQWSQPMLRNTLNAWHKPTWTKTGTKFMEQA